MHPRSIAGNLHIAHRDSGPKTNQIVVREPGPELRYQIIAIA